MKILAKASVITALIVVFAVAFKVGYHEYNRQKVISQATGVFTAPSTLASSQTSESSTFSSLVSEVLPPKDFIVFTEENTSGSPVGSTTDTIDLSHSVFVGDSVSLGFSRYCAKNGKLADTTFLTAGSYSVAYALSTRQGENKGFSHPLYKGKETPLKTAVAEIKPDNVFLCLGINDIALTGVEGTVKNYCLLINEIRKIVPLAHIYIVSTTFMVDAAQKTNLNNLNLANLNHNMKQLCTEYDNLDYVDIMSALQDAKFALAGKYCSDGFIHQSNSAYAVWLEKLGA